uniref:Protein SON n=2 Tax=Ascaris suum TaxID=6253 RepID=F1KTB3_ASCSU
MAKPSQSDEIIASLIDEVQKSSTPFDVNILIGIRESKVHGTKSISHSPKREKKERRHKDKKAKKAKKSSWRRTPSRSPFERKKRHRDRTHSSSSKKTKQRDTDGLHSDFPCVIPVESRMEKISDDEDDLPMGADFLTINADPAKAVELDPMDSTRSPVINTGSNKRREFVPTEEVFPISKKVKKERSESPPVEKNKRPVSQILAKVRAKEDASWIPRNVKLKQEGKTSGIEDVCSGRSIKEDSASFTAPKEQRKEEAESEEYGPRPAFPSGPLPISEDEDDEMQLARVAVAEKKPATLIKIASLSEETIAAVKSEKRLLGNDGEVPISDASGPSTSSHGKMSQCPEVLEVTDAEIRPCSKSPTDEKFPERKKELDDESEIEYSRQGRSESKKKRKKKKKHEKSKKRHLESVSSSSDSEKKWKAIEKKSKIQRGPISSSLAKYSRLYSDRLEEDRVGRGAIRRNSSHKRRWSIKSSDYDSATAVGDRSRDRHFRSLGQGHRRGNSRRNDKKLVSTLRRPSRGRFRRPPKSFSPVTKRRSFSHSHSRSRSLSGSSHSSEQSHHSRSHSKRSHSRDRWHRREWKRRNIAEKFDEHKIDKKKLLEIAQRNAAQMAQIGSLPSATTEARETSGQSVDQLVDFCQKLQRSQEKAERREKGEQVSSDDEEIIIPKKRKPDDDTDFMKHPFALKSSVPITINIAKTVPVLTKAPAQQTLEDSQLRICYPVSSGQEHREKDTMNVCAPLEGGSYLLPPPPPPPVLLPVAETTSSPPTSLLSCLPPPPPPPELSPKDNSAADVAGTSGLPTVSATPHNDAPSREPAVLPKTPANVGKVLAKRVQAKKRLSENPNDIEAMQMLSDADAQMNAWAASKDTAGQFTGSTGVNVLTAEQLAPDDPRFSAWAKKDLFKCASKVTGGMGHKLMQKMGWTPGEGLGKDRDGPLEPLTLDVKSDRKGLVSSDEIQSSKKSHGVVSMEVAGKHPVSMLMELCSKKHWPPPQFTCIESGPSNNRRFTWKAVVNGVEYEPIASSASKKTGKAQVCAVVLQSLGLMQNDQALW